MSNPYDNTHEFDESENIFSSYDVLSELKKFGYEDNNLYFLCMWLCEEDIRSKDIEIYYSEINSTPHIRFIPKTNMV